MAESEVARLLREIDEAYQAAEWALTGLACGTTKHDFINAKEERIAICHQELTTLIGPDEATALVAGVYFQGEKSSKISSPCEEIRERYDEQQGTRAATAHPHVGRYFGDTLCSTLTPP